MSEVRYGPSGYAEIHSGAGPSAGDSATDQGARRKVNSPSTTWLSTDSTRHLTV